MMKRFFILLLMGAWLSSPALALENGVYQDQAEGFGGMVVLTVTIRDGSIESVTTENTGGEKSEYYLKAEAELTKAIVAANGIEGVDTVSGATGTSQSILTAMEGILEQASYTGALSGLMNNAENMAQDAMDTTKTAVQNAAEGTKNAIQDAANGAKNIAEDAADSVQNAADDAVNSIKAPSVTADPKPTI